MIEAKLIGTVFGSTALGGVGIGVALVACSQELTPGQNTTLLGILSLVLVGFGGLLLKLGWRMNESIEKNTSTVGRLVEQLGILVQQNAEGQRLIRENSTHQAERIVSAIGQLREDIRHGKV